MAIIRTIQASSVHEPPKVKGSRFIAAIAPVASEDEAEAFVAERQTEHHSATHNAWAWRLPDGATRSNDDREVSGTAGRPILREIEGRELLGVAVVVTRYYGGTKLGTGGLIRAYGGTAAEALDLAEIVEQKVERTLVLCFPYELTAAVEGTLHAFAARQAGAEYGSDVRLTVAVGVEDADALAAAVTEATAGRVEVLC